MNDENTGITAIDEGISKIKALIAVREQAHDNEVRTLNERIALLQRFSEDMTRIVNMEQFQNEATRQGKSVSEWVLDTLVSACDNSLKCQITIDEEMHTWLMSLANGRGITLDMLTTRPTFTDMLKQGKNNGHI